MSNCLVLVGLNGSGKEKFAENFLSKNPSYRLLSLKSIKLQLYGTKQKYEMKVIRNVLQDHIYTNLAQGNDVLVIDGPLRAKERKSLISYASKVEDASISCVEFVTDIELCKQRTTLTKNQFINELNEYQPPEVSEGWQGIMRFDGK